MLNDVPLTPRLPASDIGRARGWYEEKLGLTPAREEELGGGLWYQTGGGWFYVYPPRVPDPHRTRRPAGR